MLLITFLYLIKDQYIILALFIKSASAIIKPIWNNKSLLLINKESINIKNYKIFLLSLINLSPLN